MSHQQYTCSLPIDSVQFFHNFYGILLIQGARRLIRKDDLRTVDHAAADTGSLQPVSYTHLYRLRSANLTLIAGYPLRISSRFKSRRPVLPLSLIHILADPQGAAEILCKAAPELDKAMVEASQEYLADKYQAEAEKWGYIDAGRWNAFYNWLNENELVTAPIQENTGFSNDSVSYTHLLERKEQCRLSFQRKHKCFRPAFLRY